MNKRLSVLLLWLLTLALAGLAVGQEPTSQPLAESPFSAEAYLEHIKYLASDELGGRQPGTEGIERAADYIARQFAEAGLKPAGDEGTWFQEFQVQRGKKLVESEAVLKVEGIHRTWQVRKDWIPLPFTTLEDVEGPLAFAGYGIKADPYEYNDYEGFDANGKILLIFRYEPQAEDPEAEFGGKTPSRYSLFSEKAQTAARQGARALLIVNPRREGLEDTLFSFDPEFSERTFDLPLVHVSRELAETLVKKAGLGDLTSLQEKLDRDRQPLSADLHLNIELKTGVRPNRFSTRNVVGLLPGNGSTQETVVIGAHYDHLGRVRPYGSGPADPPQIHNGADDNASGTAAVIELARVLAGERGLRRNLVFVTFSAEEMGLLGSAYFVEHPPVELKNVRVMVNFDMIGRLSADKFTIYGVSSGKELADLVRREADPLGVKYRAAGMVGGMAGASDHASFYEHEIPVLFAFTGIHKQYHRPEDDWELIDADGATRILALFHRIIRDLANLEEGPTFQPPTGEEQPEEFPVKPGVEHEKELQAAEEGGGHSEERSHTGEVDRPTRPRARLGIVPDFGGSDEPGVVVGSVIAGGAAKAAGIEDGDRIIRIGEHNIRDLYGYMDALREAKPGDTLEVVVVRQGKEITLKVTLKPPRRPRGQQ
jgi:hypothetical protein